ncbi:MAG: hypothetical protein KBG42_05940 [Lachnospiraceae bacterium]|nr:hypothetical protein [Lachnospiraceae bacterium]
MRRISPRKLLRQLIWQAVQALRQHSSMQYLRKLPSRTWQVLTHTWYLLQVRCSGIPIRRRSVIP